MPSYGNITKTREEALKKLYSSLKKCILEVWKKKKNANETFPAILLFCVLFLIFVKRKKVETFVTISALEEKKV